MMFLMQSHRNFHRGMYVGMIINRKRNAAYTAFDKTRQFPFELSNLNELQDCYVLTIYIVFDFRAVYFTFKIHFYVNR